MTAYRCNQCKRAFMNGKKCPNCGSTDFYELDTRAQQGRGRDSYGPAKPMPQRWDDE